MAKFPVEISDSEGIIDGLNYVLSGPSGLGQNFAGFSTYQIGYLTGNYRTPFTTTTPAFINVSPINLGACDMPDGRTWRFYFASAQPTPPFAVGNPITINGVTDDYYDGTYSPIGVVECTTTYVIVRTTSTYDIVPPSSGGTAEFVNTQTTFAQDSGWISTDCNARVTVTGSTDRVFVSSQLNGLYTYSSPSGAGQTMNIYVSINRYRGTPTSDPINPDYVFNYDGTIAQKHYVLTTSGSSGTFNELDTVFATVLDQPTEYNNNQLTPWPAYYWYILEVQFVSSNVTVTEAEFFFRSLSAQVVKQ